jgi:hypothetical protein
VFVPNAEDDKMQMAANATTIAVRKRNADSSLGMLAAVNFNQRQYSVTRKRRVTGGGGLRTGFVGGSGVGASSDDDLLLLK